MRCRWTIAPLLLAAAAAATLVAPAPEGLAQAAGPVDETFETYDGVKLRGLFYASPKGSGQPVVVMLPQYGKDMTKGAWDGLAKRLSDGGFHVLRFDWRGHGKSTDIDASRFWGQAVNQRLVRGYNPGRPKNEVHLKDFDKR